MYHLRINYKQLFYLLPSFLSNRTPRPVNDLHTRRPLGLETEGVTESINLRVWTLPLVTGPREFGETDTSETGRKG